MRTWILKALAVFFLIVPGLILFNGCGAATVPHNEVRAAIIDQLNPSEPNPAFIGQATAELQNLGCKVDYYKGEQITVDFYRKLPTMGYSLIIFRAHSGLLGNGSKTNQKTCLFTNQAYSQTAEIIDQLSDRLVKAGVGENTPVFSINSNFVIKSMQPKFNQALIIMMGCSTLDSPDLARAFIEKGASIYTGWNESVGLDYDEDAILTLLKQLSHSPVESAVKATMQEKGADPVSGAELKCYPVTVGTRTFTWLISE